MYTKVKTPQEIVAMRESGQMLATVHAALATRIEPGVTTQDLSDFAAAELKKLGGEPAFLGYQGFPEVLCVSVNDEVVHGIPQKNRLIKDGDIVSLDFGVTYKKMITDAAHSYIAGTPDPADETLLQATRQSLHAGIAQVKAGVRLGDIGHAIESVLDKAGYGVVREFVGHGVGHHVHEEPNVPNYGKPHTGPALEAGMTIAIEPMATKGAHYVFIDKDGWTVRTKDGSRSAHFEHTVLVTERGVEILTQLTKS